MTGPERLRPEPAGVVEIVIAVGFACLPPAALMTFGSFWDSMLSDQFPRVREQAPYFPEADRSPLVGADDAPTAGSGPGGSGAMPAGGVDPQDLPVHRLWFVNDNADTLLQLQRDWFAANWRLVTPESRGLGWGERRDAFIDWLSGLDAHLAATANGRLGVRFYELSYVSHVYAGGTWKHHGEFDKVFNSAGLDELPSYLRRENVRLEQDFLVIDETGTPEARLLAKIRPGYAATGGTPVYVLELKVRSVSRPRRVEAIGEYLDLAHRAVLDITAAVVAGPAGEQRTGPAGRVVWRSPITDR